jgi:hypothetical protein
MYSGREVVARHLYKVATSTRKRTKPYYCYMSIFGLIIKQASFDQHKHHISHNHSIAIDMTGCILTGYPTVKGEEIEVAESAVSSIDLSTRVLVAEPEPDLQQIYNIWLHSMGFKEVVITDSGKECLDEIPTIIAVNKSVNKNKNKTQEFDMIILDIHILRTFLTFRLLKRLSIEH